LVVTALASVFSSGGTTTLLLEREAQVAGLQALADAARSGGGRLVVIEGTAGIGKTRLLAETRAMAGSAGMRVLAARGGELESEFAYGIVRQLFEPLLAGVSPDLRAELLSGPAARVEPLFGASQLVGSQDAPAEGSFAILHGLYWLAVNVAFHQPTLLAIDDLHWADGPSLRWLLYLTRRLEGVPVLVTVATRPPEAESRDPTLVAELVADPEAAAIRPEPLGRASIAVLARELHGLELDDAFSAAVQTATGGNPLFVVAVLDAVEQEGTSPTAEHAARLLEIGAQGVSRVVGLRLARLQPEALALLRAASILGDGTELRHAGALARVEAGALGPAAAALVRLDLLRREDPLEFSHPVVRSAVYETLDVVERAAGHRAAAELLLNAGAPPESAASHLLRVTPHADPFVVSTLRQAAERSLFQGTTDAAVRYLTRALEEQTEPAPRAEVLVELGLAERRTNGPAAADHLRAGIELLADPGRRGAVALELGRALWFTGRVADALAVFEQALEEVDRERDPDLYELLEAELISSAWWHRQTYPIAEARIGELDLDALHGGLGSEILLATMAHYEYRLALHRERAIELARRALASGNLLESGSIAFLYAVVTLFRSGLLDEAIPIFNKAIALARRRGDIFNVAYLLMWRGACQTDRGDLRAAVADLREAIELSVAHGMRVAWPYNIGYLAQALLEQGEADEAARVIDRGDFPEQLPPDDVQLVGFRLNRARVRIETGSPERGVEELLQVGETVRLVPHDNPSSLPWRRWAAEGLRLLDRNDEARALANEELALARRWGAPHAIGASLRALGLVESGKAGIGLLREAVEMLASTEARLEYALALVDLGAALRRANQRTEARERLREGVDLAQRIGAFGLAGRGNEEIAATGARPRKVLPTGLDALTASERRVAQLAAEGMPNREIAQTLFVTIKTVEVHLSHAYRKLEIDSRAQLDKALLGRLAAAIRTGRVELPGAVPPDYLDRLGQAFKPGGARAASRTDRDAAGVEALVEPLSGRELEVLGLLAAGKSNQQIADELFVVLDTVKKHVGRILDKLGAANRTQAVARARVLGLLP
jgi:DNA-binding NarL/FixJ family response regulator